MYITTFFIGPSTNDDVKHESSKPVSILPNSLATRMPTIALEQNRNKYPKANEF